MKLTKKQVDLLPVDEELKTLIKLKTIYETKLNIINKEIEALCGQN